MVGDICDEDELNTGYRAEGSYYSVFWWFMKMGTALASLISGVLIVLTMFDETQVTKVDRLYGDVRELRATLTSSAAPEGAVGPLLERARRDAAELHSYLQGKALAGEQGAGKGAEHYSALAHTTETVKDKLAGLSAAPKPGNLEAQLGSIDAALVLLTKQQPYTLLMMRAVEIGLPLLACCLSLLFILRYSLTEERSREIKAQLEQRHARHDLGADPAVV
jgi:Na+/melibiose symporter-like transporter